MDKPQLCVACALAVAEGSRNAIAGIPSLVDGTCPECGGTRALSGQLPGIAASSTSVRAAAELPPVADSEKKVA